MNKTHHTRSLIFCCLLLLSAHTLWAQSRYTEDRPLIITGDWSNKFESESLAAGFITPYAMSEYNEDFAETLSYYLIYTAAQWTSKLKLAGDEGAAIIERKIELIRKYMLTAWDIDIDELRDVLQRRINDVVAGKIDITSLE